MSYSPARYALGRIRDRGMNKTETAYDDYLRKLKLAGEVVWYSFEPLKFRLADKTFYTPDFGVLNRDGTFELHEVKGFWEDDARVKIKVAAETFPFKFIAVKKAPARVGGWAFEVF